MSNIQMKSEYQIEDVDCVDFMPEDKKGQEKYKYYCPICLRYFNVILLSGCCTNYICHMCVNDL